MRAPLPEVCTAVAIIGAFATELRQGSVALAGVVVDVVAAAIPSTFTPSGLALKLKRVHCAICS